MERIAQLKQALDVGALSTGSFMEELGMNFDANDLMSKVEAIMTDPNIAPYLSPSPGNDLSKATTNTLPPSPGLDVLRRAEMKMAQANNDKDKAYEERNKLVALLARLFPSGIAKTHIQGWEPEWDNCVYIDLPTGQASWHYHDREAALFADLPPYRQQWDNHTTGEKYARIEKLTKTLDKFDVAITPKSAQLPEDPPEDAPSSFPAEIDATVKVTWVDMADKAQKTYINPPKKGDIQTLTSVFLPPGQTFTFENSVVLKALHIGMEPSPYSQPGQGATVNIVYEDA